MRLIDEFESADEQNVKTFNEVFRFTPIFTVPDDVPVQICEPTSGDLRWVKIGEDFTRINLALSNNSKDAPPKYERPSLKPPRGRKRVEFIQPYKTCTKCKEYMHFDKFSKHKNSLGGVRAQCKKCCSIQVRQIEKQRIKNELHNTAE